MGHVDTNLLFSFILGLLGLMVSVVIWAASTHAARIQAREARMSREALIDIDTLNSIKRVYESAIEQLEDEVRRLRAEARAFEEKAIHFESELQKFRDRINKDQADREAREPEPIAEPPVQRPASDPVAET